MQITEIITQLRKDNGLSQEDLAQRLFVTRQAVSKWERGEALPDLDNFLRISQAFGIPISTLMGAPERRICQSCAMPLDDAAMVSADNAHYCKWCFVDGGYPQPGITLEQMIETILRVTPPGVWPDEDAARRYLSALLPELERWKG